MSLCLWLNEINENQACHQATGPGFHQPTCATGSWTFWQGGHRYSGWWNVLEKGCLSPDDWCLDDNLSLKISQTKIIVYLSKRQGCVSTSILTSIIQRKSLQHQIPWCPSDLKWTLGSVCISCRRWDRMYLTNFHHCTTDSILSSNRRNIQTVVGSSEVNYPLHNDAWNDAWGQP